MEDVKNKWRFLVIGDFPVLESSFVNEVRSERAKDPFPPLLIFVSSKLLGLHLRRLLAEQGVPHFNLRFKTLEEFAREVSAPHLNAEGKKEIPSYADELILGDIARSLTGKERDFYFKEIADRSGFHEAALSTLKDFKDACLLPSDVERLLRDPKLSKQVHLQKLRDFVKLWKGYEERLDGLRFYDESDLMVSANQWVKESAFFRQTPKILIYGFYDFNQAQKRLLQTCFDEKPSTAFLPYEPTQAFEFVKPVLNWLRDTGFREVAHQDQALQPRPVPLDHLCLHLFNGGKPLEVDLKGIEILSAPGEAREVRELIRKVLQVSQNEGVAFHEIGILLRTPEEYLRLFQETFGNLGIKPFFREGLPLIGTRAGRSVMLLIDIAHKNFSRQSVMEFATFAKLRTEGFPSKKGFGLNLSQWEAFSIHAGIVEGQKEWQERLLRLRESLLKSEEAGEEEEGKRRFHKRDIPDLDQLIHFIKKLFSSIEGFLGAKTWNGKVEALLQALDGLVEQDEECLLVQQALRRLSELDGTAISPTQTEFVRLVGEVLEVGSIAAGKFQRHGPAIVHLMAARGVPFRVVIVPGMVEKSFPPLTRQDAILLDHERKAINRLLSHKENGPLPMKAEGRLNEERLLFRLAVGAARERLILSFPRIEIGTGRERLPSSFLLAMVEALIGKRVDFNQIEQFPGLVRFPLSGIAVASPEEALDEMEYDLSVGQKKLSEKKLEPLAYLKEVSPFFSRGFLLESSRWGKRVFTSYDGRFGSKEVLDILRERHSILKKSISPTRLEAYATCPYQYLLGVIMGIEALTEPEREVSISPQDRGKLIHEILWQFFTDVKKERGPLSQLRIEDLRRLEEIANRKFSEFEKHGVTGFPMQWEVAKRSMLGMLREFVLEELDENEFIPTYFEVRYGMRRHGSKDSEISTEEPVSLELGGKTLRLRGRIDRIDLSKDGKRARVRDYKAGKVAGKPNAFGGGKSLQLPLYLYAARQLLRSLHHGIEVESAEYYFLKDQKSVPFEASQLDGREPELHAILQTIAEGIEEGIFIPFPDNQNCRYRFCDFRVICSSWSRLLFDRKSKDPRVKRYLEMATEEAEEAEE